MVAPAMERERGAEAGRRVPATATGARPRRRTTSWLRTRPARSASPPSPGRRRTSAARRAGEPQAHPVPDSAPASAPQPQPTTPPAVPTTHHPNLSTTSHSSHQRRGHCLDGPPAGSTELPSASASLHQRTTSDHGGASCLPPARAHPADHIISSTRGRDTVATTTLPRAAGPGRSRPATTPPAPRRRRRPRLTARATTPAPPRTPPPRVLSPAEATAGPAPAERNQPRVQRARAAARSARRGGGPASWPAGSAASPSGRASPATGPGDRQRAPARPAPTGVAGRADGRTAAGTSMATVPVPPPDGPSRIADDPGRPTTAAA